MRRCVQEHCVNPAQSRRTGLWCPLHQFISESSDAFAWDGSQGEGVLGVRFETLHSVRIPGPEGQLLLWERREGRGGQRGATMREGGEEKSKKRDIREELEKRSWPRVRPLDTRVQDFGVNLLKIFFYLPFKPLSW